jgi:hypothetical protein
MDVKKAANAAFLSVETGIGLLNRPPSAETI